jgi:two-component system sensor histidine kinase TctE
MIKGQALLLAELLNNLIDNALLYTPAHGHVTVSVSKTHESVMLVVEDTGQGIPLTERERVFDRFYRILGTKADGSGLGLAIVREIALQHDATIRITDSLTNEPHGSGTRIEVSFIAS